MSEAKDESSAEGATSNDLLYVVMLEDGVWLAPWDGDPGRTLKRKHAKKFTTLTAAHRAIAKALRYRAFSPIVEAYNMK